jgi:predicted nucleic acid-binding protein
MAVLLDSSIVLAEPDLKHRLGSTLEGRDEEFFISVVTVAELLYGAGKAPDAGTRRLRVAFAEAVMDQFPVISIDRPIARLHAGLLLDLEKQKKKLGSNEMWIASTCLACGLVLATLEPAAFAGIEGLKIEDWGVARAA